jgi:hypothetical protein
MDAGPDLDAEIARRVFGWRNVRPALLRPGRYVGDAPDTLVSQDLPPYSSDIAAAWQVVEAMCERGWNSTLWYEDGCWHVLFDYPGLGYCTVDCRGETVSLAICRAALYAVKTTPE